MKKDKCLVIIFIFLLVSSNLFAQQARQVILFNDDWKFFKGDVADADKPSFNDVSWRQLTLPHDWSIEGPFSEQWASATAYLPAGIGWYRKTFELSPGMAAKNIYLHFDGVYKNSEVWINGHYLGKRPNGFISFRYSLTRYLNATGKNIISVKADHTDFADSRWYTGSGIYRNVYMVVTGKVDIDLWGVGFSTPEITSEKALAKVSVSLTNHSLKAADVIVKSVLFSPDKKQVVQEQQATKTGPGSASVINIKLPVISPVLWSPEQPALYRLEVTIYVAGKKTDQIEQQVGFRYTTFDKDKGFFLNGKNLKIKGVCIHDDAGALGVAVPEEVWIRRLKILKEGGCNSVRLSHNPHADYLYDLCDKMGILIMEEAFDEWEIGKNKWIKGWNVGTPGKDGYHEYFKEWADVDLRDMVLRGRNHPSIILWSIGNEIDYPNDPYSHPVLSTGNNPQIYGKGYVPANPAASGLTEIGKHLVAIVKQFDTTRPVTAALAGVVMSNEVGFPEVLDVVGYNYQEFRYADDHKKYPGRIIYGSENSLNESAWDAVADNDYISAQWLWTGIDYLGEARQWPTRSAEPGLIDLAGFPKSSYYFRQSLWTSEPMVHLATSVISAELPGNRSGRNGAASWNYTMGDSVRVKCFTNCEAAELFLNGKSLGQKSMAQAKEKVIYWDISYQPGELLVKAYKNGNEASRHKLITASEPAGIKAVADYKSFGKSRKQLTHVEIDVVDKNGNLVFAADNEITINIEGPATLLGLESGNSTSHEDYKSNKRKAWHGKLLAYIQSGQTAGNVKIKITSPALTQESLIIPVK